MSGKTVCMSHTFILSDHFNRRSIRLGGHDYAADGKYFVTICTKGRSVWFGTVANGVMYLNAHGTLVDTYLRLFEWIYPFVHIDTWVIMPDHLHCILEIHHGHLTAPVMRRKPLGELIGAFKTITTRHLNVMSGATGMKIWQRNFYEHIVRTHAEYQTICRYIRQNPSRWRSCDL